MNLAIPSVGRTSGALPSWAAPAKQLPPDAEIRQSVAIHHDREDVVGVRNVGQRIRIQQDEVLGVTGSNAPHVFDNARDA